MKWRFGNVHVELNVDHRPDETAKDRFLVKLYREMGQWGLDGVPLRPPYEYMREISELLGGKV